MVTVPTEKGDSKFPEIIQIQPYTGIEFDNEIESICNIANKIK